MTRASFGPSPNTVCVACLYKSHPLQPSAASFKAGNVIFAPNLEGWKDVPLKKALEKQLDVPVFVENDGNIAVLGVHVAELKGKPRNVVGIFVGTGIGGGVIDALQDEMMSVIVETANDYAMPGAMKGVEIIASKLGDDAGITGAAVLARKEAKKAA